MRLWILGRGGQARETAELAAVLGYDDVVLVDAAGERTLTGGALVLGLGFPAVRARLFARFAGRPGFDFPTLVHPRADIGASSVLADAVVVSSGCVVTSGVTLGAGTLLNPRSGIGHDTVVGRCCVVNPGANISGSVTLGDGVLVGSGATVLQGLTLGDGCVVGAGAVVTRDVGAGVTVTGVPARPVAAAPAADGDPTGSAR